VEPNINPTPPLAFSRRGLLRGATALAAAAASEPVRGAAGDIIAYVGAYTDRGRGIHIFNVNPSDGALTPWKILTGLPSPSALYIHPNKRHMYAVNEISNFGGVRMGSVTSLEIDPGTGDLRIMNVMPSGGPGPAHLSVDPSGRFVLAANYGGGSVSVLPIQSDGTLRQPVDVRALSGPLGPQPAVDAPPGSFAISGHDAPHAHQAITDRDGNFVFVPDLGTDRIFIYRLDKERGTLTPNEQPWLQSSPGSGPRHMDFHPNKRWAYAITEEASTMLLMDYDATRGTLQIRQSAPTLPDGYAGTNFPSAILVSEDGNTLYGANRLFDSIVVFNINAEGWMLKAGEVWTRGSYPRDFKIEPNGNFMYVLHSRSDNITTFRVNRTTGGLTFENRWTPVGNPSSIVFLTL
jgi:6-phosphogluconolactonase (cycloisomerase 2 family)